MSAISGRAVRRQPQDIGGAVPVLHDRLHRALRRLGVLPYRSHDRFPDGGALPPYFVRLRYRTKYGSTIAAEEPHVEAGP